MDEVSALIEEIEGTDQKIKEEDSEDRNSE